MCGLRPRDCVLVTIERLCAGYDDCVQVTTERLCAGYD